LVTVGRAAGHSDDCLPCLILAAVLVIAVAAPAIAAQPANLTNAGAAGAVELPAPPQSDNPTPSQADNNDGAATTAGDGLLGDIAAYYTAPLHWDAHDWEFFAGALAAIGVAHSFDRRVREDFVHGNGTSGSSDDLEDALPAAALLAGTFLYSGVVDDSAGWKTEWNMVEAAGLASVTNYAVAYATGRERPYQTSDPNRWGSGGSSFPSLHVTAAFAVGTVFAESSNYVWFARFVGYGLAGFTGYLRLKHDQHWLSDTVAGAALGSSTGMFVLHRSQEREPSSQLSLEPIPGGAMLAYHATLPY
jgi:membrane-associated phospholipid phosphatase